MRNSSNTANQRKTAPFRYDMVGSFLRSGPIKAARAEYLAGLISLETLTAVEDMEIRTLVEKQKSLGLQAVTDGEFRRSWWHLDFMWGLTGVGKAVIHNGYQFNGVETRPETVQLTGRIRFGKHPFLKHFEFLRQAAGDGVAARQTIPAPAQFLAELQRDENWISTENNYPDLEALVSDIVKAYRDAVQAFYDIGCRNLQLDDCTWGMLCDRSFREKGMNTGIDAEEIAGLYLRVNNEAIRDRPEDMVITTHVCRGNYRSTWATSGGYEPVAEALFGGENVDAYYLEFDTDRAGDFSPLRFVTGDKFVVLGLISSKTGELEDKTAIRRRIDEAARYVPADRLCLSPQCGFASTEEGNLLAEERQWDKLRLVKEIADEVWN